MDSGTDKTGETRYLKKEYPLEGDRQDGQTIRHKDIK